MQELERYPALHQNKITRITEELKKWRDSNKELKANLESY